MISAIERVDVLMEAFVEDCKKSHPSVHFYNLGGGRYLWPVIDCRTGCPTTKLMIFLYTLGDKRSDFLRGSQSFLDDDHCIYNMGHGCFVASVCVGVLDERPPDIAALMDEMVRCEAAYLLNVAA